MKTSFEDWMLKREAMNTTGIYTPVSGPALQNSSQMGFSLNQPQPVRPKANVPLPMDAFKNWYNQDRGSWNDVMKAAQMSPEIRAFMANAARQLVSGPYQTGPSVNDEGEFDIDAPTKLGSLADQLQAMVRKVIPNHGRRNSMMAPSPSPSMSSSGPQQPSGGSMGSQLQNMQSRSQNPETQQIYGVLRGLLLRLDDIERRIGGKNPAVNPAA